MNKEKAIYFAGLMEEYLNIPSYVCESIKNELINEKYNKVINFVIDRRKELENKANYKSYRDIVNMYLQLQQENKRLKEEYVLLQNASDKVEEELQNRIDKAIYYIEMCWNAPDIDGYTSFDLSKEETEKLLKILKGDSNE